MAKLNRDKVTKFSFAFEVFGKERTMGDSLKFDIDAVALERIENPETVSGWKPAQDRIIHSTTGDGNESEKSAVITLKNHRGRFQMVDNVISGIVYKGDIHKVKTNTGIEI